MNEVKDGPAFFQSSEAEHLCIRSVVFSLHIIYHVGGIKGKISTVYAREKKFFLLKYLSDSSVKELLNRVFSPYLSADYLYRPE